MAATYEAIATQTVSGTPTSVSFTSIAGTWTDLRLVTSAKTAAAAAILIQYNGDTGSNYSTTFLYGDGSSAGSGRQSGSSSITTNTRPNSAANMVLKVDIMNYSNSSTYKTCLIRTDDASSGVEANVGLWRSTSAITRVDILSSGSTFSSGTVFTLYGIKAA